jgi:hypothetical protein
VSETNSEYIDIELNITGLHNKVLISEQQLLIISKMHFIGRPTYLREVEKT